MLLALVGPRSALSQSANAYFHEAAQQYVQGNPEQARETVERGLEVAPSDSRLRALLEKLERQNQSGGGGGSSSGERGQSDDSQERDASEQADQSDQGQQNRSSESGGAASRDDPAQSPESSGLGPRQQQQQNASRPDGPRANRPARPRNVLSRAQANRLLQALETQEKRLLRQLRVRDFENVTVEKDW